MKVSLYGLGMAAQPCFQTGFIQGADGDIEHKRNHLGFCSYKLVPIESQKDIHGHKYHALVAVNKGIVVCKTESIGCSQTQNISIRIITPTMRRSCQNGVNKTLIAYPQLAVMLANLGWRKW